MWTEVCQIIKAAKAGDIAKAEAYANLLAENLDKNGQHKFARRVRDAVNGVSSGSEACLDDTEQLPNVYPPGPRVRF